MVVGKKKDTLLPLGYSISKTKLAYSEEQNEIAEKQLEFRCGKKYFLAYCTLYLYIKQL